MYTDLHTFVYAKVREPVYPLSYITMYNHGE